MKGVVDDCKSEKGTGGGGGGRGMPSSLTVHVVAGVDVTDGGSCSFSERKKIQNLLCVHVLRKQSTHELYKGLCRCWKGLIRYHVRLTLKI